MNQPQGISNICARLCAALLASAALAAHAQPVQLNVALGSPLVLAGAKQTAVVKVALTGAEAQSQGERTPVNVAIVLDRSGSMAGEKIVHAKQAAAMAVERLNASDVASVITYDDVVKVVVPATKVADKSVFRRAIARIQPGGSTALFAGVAKGATEVEKYLQRERVNRVILLSDGLANVGPSSPEELGSLGASLAKQGISVTTIGLGLGYNEDLMARLAGMSDGSHAFVEHPQELARIFDAEFGDVLSVIAQEVKINIRCADGIKPLRVLGREADIAGQNVVLGMNQLYGAQEKFVLLEVEVPAGQAGQQRAVAEVDVAYFNTGTRQTERLANKVALSYSESADKVARATDKKVMADTVEQVANTISKEAVKLKDEGKITEARSKLEEGAKYLEQNAQQYQDPKLGRLSSEFKKDSAELDDEKEWNRKRKSMVKRQYSTEKQQKF
jgi:Ca-activated chloride channel family protein